MITKAIIEKVLSNYKVKVRIPVINQIKTAPNATFTDDLYSSIVCTIPSISIPLEVGDVVIVGFEDNNFKKPIILGYLYREEAISKHVDFNLSNLIVDGTTNLSKSTYIGDITPTEISYLAGVNTNIQSQLNTLASRISLLEQAIATPPEDDDNTEEVTPEPKPDPEPEPSEPGTEEPSEPDTPVEDDFVELENSDFYENYNITSTGAKSYDLYKNTKIYQNPNPNHLHISSLYGEVRSNGSTHYAVDCQNCTENFNNSDYDVLLSPAKGKIIHKYVEADNSGYGNGLIIEYGRNYTVLFAHMKATDIHNNLSVGTIVTAGQVIGRQGNTGTSSGEHLHLAIYKEDVVKEPYAVLFGDWKLPDYEE